MLKGVAYRRIDEAGVHITVDGNDALVAADTVIVCAGQLPRRPVWSAAARPRVSAIGGAREAGELDAERAMLEGARLAAAL